MKFTLFGIAVIVLCLANDGACRDRGIQRSFQASHEEERHSFIVDEGHGEYLQFKKSLLFRSFAHSL